MEQVGYVFRPEVREINGKEAFQQIYNQYHKSGFFLLVTADENEELAVRTSTPGTDV